MGFRSIVKLILLLCGWLIASAASAAPVILVFGDSLSSAYGIPQNTGWVSLLQQRVRPMGYSVANASISGETTSGGRTRIEPALREHQPDIVILELGANDGLRGLPPEATRTNLQAIIDASRKAHAQVLLLGMRLPPNYGMDYTKKFHAIFSELAEQNRLRAVPFMLEGLGAGRELFQPDGIHPTVDAQGIILDTIWKQLEPMVRH